MSLFHSILSQLQEKIEKGSDQSEKIASIITSIIGTTVSKDQIVVQKTTVRVKVAPTIKMAISLKKEKILTALKEANLQIDTIA
ncbi:MAG TPA: hypothetical protein VL576_03715 [Candidatus Paceibacterota bacterium]|jgi:hypothetical protein|nr:hypothetical protein [Candidatus Paceibacterota bacterium]